MSHEGEESARPDGTPAFEMAAESDEEASARSQPSAPHEPADGGGRPEEEDEVTPEDAQEDNSDTPRRRWAYLVAAAAVGAFAGAAAAIGASGTPIWYVFTAVLSLSVAAGAIADAAMAPAADRTPRFGLAIVALLLLLGATWWLLFRDTEVESFQMVADAPDSYVYQLRSEPGGEETFRIGTIAGGQLVQVECHVEHPEDGLKWYRLVVGGWAPEGVVRTPAVVEQGDIQVCGG